MEKPLNKYIWQKKPTGKKLVNLDYIGAYSLNGKDLTVEITGVSVKKSKR